MKKPMLQTTFKALRAAGACPSGYVKLAKALGGAGKYGRTKPINVLTIARTNGIADALWVVRNAVPAEQLERAGGALRLFAADCAERVLPIFDGKYPGDKRPREAIEAARAFARGEITAEELRVKRANADFASVADAAADAAYDAAFFAANAAANANARDAYATTYATFFAASAARDAYATTYAAERKVQVKLLRKYLRAT